MIHTAFARQNFSLQNVVFKFLRDKASAVVGMNKSRSCADCEKLVKTFDDGRRSHVPTRKSKGYREYSSMTINKYLLGEDDNIGLLKSTLKRFMG